jgi:hypothetical protein
LLSLPNLLAGVGDTVGVGVSVEVDPRDGAVAVGDAASR